MILVIIIIIIIIIIIVIIIITLIVMTFQISLPLSLFCKDLIFISMPFTVFCNQNICTCFFVLLLLTADFTAADFLSCLQSCMPFSLMLSSSYQQPLRVCIYFSLVEVALFWKSPVRPVIYEYFLCLFVYLFVFHQCLMQWVW
jgi:hypothetical protein